LAKIMDERIEIREGGKPHKVTKEEAIFRSQIAKAIKGDTRAARFIMEEAAQEEAAQAGLADAELALVPFVEGALQSEALFKNLHRNLISEDEQIELARLAKVIDLGGDFTALSAADFARIKQITEKGRGKEVTPLV